MQSIATIGLDIAKSVLPPTRPMAQPKRSIVDEKKIAPHIPGKACRGARTVRSAGKTSRSTRSATSMSVRRVNCCARPGASATERHCFIAQGYRTAALGPLKPRCCPKAPERKIPRSIYEDARDVARALANTTAFELSRRNRKRVEMLTSSESCDLADLDCAVRAAHKMSSRWAPLHRTSAALQNSSLDRRQQLRCAPRDRCRASAPFDQKPPPVDGRIIRARVSVRSQTTRPKPPTSATKSTQSGHRPPLNGLHLNPLPALPVC